MRRSRNRRALPGLAFAVVLATGLGLTIGSFPMSTMATPMAEGSTGALQPQGEPVMYLAADDTPFFCTTYDVIESASFRADLEGGWFVVPAGEEVVLSGGARVTGDVNLILCDGATLRITPSLDCTSGAELAIYAQSRGEDAGSMIVGNGAEYDRGIIVPTLIVNGGNVTSVAGVYAHGIETDQLMVKQGSVTASTAGPLGSGSATEWAGISAKSITFSRGTVTATSPKKTGILCSGPVHVGRATVTVTGGEYGIRMTDATRELDAQAGSLTCQGGIAAISSTSVSVGATQLVWAGDDKDSATLVNDPSSWQHTEKWARIATPVHVESVELNPATATLEIGKTMTLAATVTPDDADDKSVNWASSDENVATVTDGVVTAMAPGKATITVTSVDNDEATATCTVTVSATPEPKPTPTPTPSNSYEMYRLYNPNSGEHFYTASKLERDNVIAAGWNDEGVGWIAPAEGDPVYRLYNKFGGEHHYTLSKAERDSLVKAGWTDEGIGWKSANASGIPLYRQYNPNAFANNHNFTTSSFERDYLLKIGWSDEGVAWYGVRGLK